MKNISYKSNVESSLIGLLDGSGFSESKVEGLTSRLALADNKNSVYLFQANCLEMMDRLIAKHPNGCFDMIFADPPYFLSNGGISCQNGKMVKVHKGDWDKSQGAELNHSFNREWLARCQKLLNPNGTIWVSGTMHVIYSLGYAMQQLGFKILNDIAWEKPNPPPNLACRYFTHSTETILWAAKNEKSKHCFNYSIMKKYNGDKQMKSVWRLTSPANSEKLFGKHPTQKPLALIERCIEASTNAGDFIMDPFSGSSTTGVAAIKLKRKFCGIELEDAFIDLSIKRLESALAGSETNLMLEAI
jgi:site-specific DNA-methyltransferase (adenine-specific)